MPICTICYEDKDETEFKPPRQQCILCYNQRQAASRASRRDKAAPPPLSRPRPKILVPVTAGYVQRPKWIDSRPLLPAMVQQLDALWAAVVQLQAENARLRGDISSTPIESEEAKPEPESEEPGLEGSIPEESEGEPEKKQRRQRTPRTVDSKPCDWVFMEGKYKGEQCSKHATVGNRCSDHCRRKPDPMEYRVGMCEKEIVGVWGTRTKCPNDATEGETWCENHAPKPKRSRAGPRCTYILTRGPRAGEPCGNKAKEGDRCIKCHVKGEGGALAT